MPDPDPIDAEAEANADRIKQVERTEHGPRGNVHSEPDGTPPQDPPPPLPN